MALQVLSFEKYLDSVRRNRLRIIVTFVILSLMLPLAGYTFWGAAYFSNTAMLLGGGAVNLAACLVAYQISRRSTGLISNLYPDTHQSISRVLSWFLFYAGVHVAILFFLVAIYDRFTVFGYHLNISPALWAAFSLVGGSLVGAGLTEMSYTFAQWRINQHELQQMEHSQLETELDIVKQQVNPHFLFNCLNSLSILISEAPGTAEKFVDEMSKVYRYLLQVNGVEKESSLVSLEAELRFIKSYIYLLETRYESGIRFDLQISEPCLAGQIAPLTIQTLIDNATRHNVVSVHNPLEIKIRTTATGQLEVSNNLQKRVVNMPVNNAGLASLVSRYRLLFNAAGTVQVKQDDASFTVTLPLIYT
ncbi:sensor histidine kinase [Dyadobacter luticola]|uniref:Histidine kinase n=1 Tax=Dyadobacter luticola TaxID=1979387 RepID=A0A5R9L1A8_9BACT|nr:sensor histidine kinase [Dyadobacter luticola]TLV02135.1 histidine kinase [Dyadobacter luticola]